MSQPYRSYKDSGIAWLGRTPSHWPVTRLRFLAELNPSRGEVRERGRSEEVSFIPMEAVGEQGELELDRTRPIAEVEAGYTYFRDGDVTFAKITPCFENGKGAIMRGLRGGIGFGTTELTVLRPRPGLASAEYLFWLFSAPPFRRLGEAAMYGAGGQKRVPDAFVRNFAMAFPPLDEQRAIAAFLDRETGKIDALAEEQRRLIALLKEKRQAVITHATTKGLDPTAPLKPSGIDWLGDIPAHWTTCRLKRAFRSVDYGISDALEGEGAVAVLRMGNIEGGVGRLDNLKYVSEVPADLLLEDGDLLFNRTNSLDLIGKVGKFAGQIRTPISFASYLVRLRLAGGHSPDFFTFLLNTPRVLGEARARAFVAIGQCNLNPTRYGQIHIAVPPAPEQEQIAIYLRQQTSVFDALISEAETAIDLLQERRSALIAAAVTGKIDVRAEAPDATEAA